MRANNYSKDDKPRQIPLSGGRSLQEYLIEQLGYRNLSEEEMLGWRSIWWEASTKTAICVAIWNLVADDIAFTLGEEVSPERLEAILKVIHDLEPAGIGARNLRERLLLQLLATAYDDPFAAAGAQDTDLLFRRIRKKTLRRS